MLTTMHTRGEGGGNLRKNESSIRPVAVQKKKKKKSLIFAFGLTLKNILKITLEM